MPPKNNDYSNKIDSVSIFFSSGAKRTSGVSRKSKRTQGLSILFHGENHLFHAGSSSNKINLCPIGWVRYVTQRAQNFEEIVVIVGPKPQVRRHYDVFVPNQRFLFV
jgi:hypothetical protein